MYKYRNFSLLHPLEVKKKGSKMSATVLKFNNNLNMSSNHADTTTWYPSAANLNGNDKENNSLKDAPKFYKSLFDFCNQAADELPQRQAFYAMNLEDILWKVQEWKKCLPNVEIFYAVKANTDPILLQLLTKLGLSFDCASMGEIKMAFKAGASPNNVIFAHTIKTAEELKFASDHGVELMTFDNEDELLKIHRFYPNAKLLIRIIPKYVDCSYDLSEKFGCTEEEAVKLLKLAHRLNLNVIGVSFHVGSRCNDPISYISTIETSRLIFDAAKEIGFKFTILDIGGGYFGATGTQHLFYEMADGIKKALKEHFSDNQIRIIAEPGSYIVDSACNLVCTILGRRCFDNPGKGKPERHYFFNDSVYGSFNGQLHSYGVEKPVPLLAASEIQSRPEYDSRIYGQTCGSVDVVMDNVTLLDLKVGERVTWFNMGAYCQGVVSTFCAVPCPVARYVFVQNYRLNLDWIPAQKNIRNFLKNHVSFIGCLEEDF